MNWSWLSFIGFAAELVEYGYICRETWTTCRCEPVCLDLYLYGDLLPVLHDAAEQCLGWRYRVEVAPPTSRYGLVTNGRVGRMWRWGYGWAGDRLTVDSCRHDEHGEYQGMWRGCHDEHDPGVSYDRFWRTA